MDTVPPFHPHTKSLFDHFASLVFLSALFILSAASVTKNLLHLQNSMSSAPSIDIPASNPCASCNTQNIRDVVLPSSPDCRGLRRDALEWTAIVKNKHCGLCKLIVRTLFQDASFIEAMRGGQSAKVKIVDRDVGKVIWKPVVEDGKEPDLAKGDLRSGWVYGNGCMVRYVRRIDVSAEQNGRYWQGVVRVSGYNAIDEKDRLLLVRSMPFDRVDVRRIKYWLGDCKAYHGSTCQPTSWNDLNLHGVRMIDVKDRCVVSASAGCQYLALSYCWGDPTKIEHLKLTNANYEHLHTLGGLSQENGRVPHTVRDAIHLTEVLGYQYLWVDALCIVQDNKKDKEDQLNLMDRLYKSAIITLAAAAGDNAWSGLPGALPRSRSSLLLTEMVDGITLVTASKDYIGAIESAAWSRRAWVLQERNLSSRLLVFTPRQVFWECRKAVWSEELQLECFDPQVQVEVDYSLERFKKPRSDLSPVQRYAFLLAQYTSRELTNQDDALNAVQGLLNDFQTIFPEGFFWGLPESIFDTALLWNFGVYQQAPKPRRAMFPSWCWAGWQAVATFSIGSPFDHGFQGQDLSSNSLLGKPESTKDASTVRSEVAWFRITEAPPSWKAIQNNWISQAGSTSHTESLAKWQAQDSNSVLESTLQGLQQVEIPASHALAFWTQIVQLEVDRTPHRNNPSAMAVRDRDGQDVGHINVTAEWRKSCPDQLSFILLARNLRWIEPFLDLMCVEWVSGFAFRVQVVRNAVITDRVWGTLDPEWRLVILV